jgi:hypothetical protein
VELTVAQFARACAQTPAAVRAANPNAVKAAALEIVTTQRRLLAAATGGDSRLSGVGKRGAKLSVGFDVKGLDNATALIQARGPWQFVENDVERHRVPRPRSRRGRRRYAVLPGVGFVYDHVDGAGGSTGRHPFERGVDQSRQAAIEAFAEIHWDAIASSIGATRS